MPTTPSQTKTPDEFQVGDYLSETLVTDTIVWKVVKKTAQTITLAPTVRTNEVVKEDHSGNPNYPICWYAVEVREGARTKTLRRRKNGTFRTGDYARCAPLRKAPMIDGKAVSRVDWSF